KVFPNYADAYYGAGLALAQLGQPSNAVQMFQSARNLYVAQRNSQWAANAQAQIARVQGGGE
ncbi:MAG: Tfp pilus assembly protein PilF, partial [Pseudanabaenales cyanobacterium]|nr:Tfp pilus assembly protein PilF [Pseudanabaenales cyanobacterium]